MVKEANYSFTETSEIKLILDSYEDIFSDFDPRPYSQKGLSEDFLVEAKRAAIAKGSEKVNILFVVPKAKRIIKEEIVIKERLERYFKKHLDILKNEKKKILKKGFLFTGVGVILMLIATFLFFKFHEINLILSFFTVLLEPASWFLVWEGMDMVLFSSKETDLSLHFYNHMANADIKFASG